MNIKMQVAGLSCLLILSGLIGCGSKPGLERSAVSGKVTFDGKPVENGLIAFIPSGETKGPSAGAAIKNGEYTIPKEIGPTPGPHRVEITANRVEGRVEVQGVVGSQGGLSGAGTADNLVMFIPDKYNTQSTLTYKVAPGNNQSDFPLVSK